MDWMKATWEKAEQWAHACSSAIPGQCLEPQRGVGELCTQKRLPLAAELFIQMALPALRAGTVKFQGAFEFSLWIHRTLGQTEAIVTNQEPSQSTQAQAAQFSWEVTVHTADLFVAMSHSLINTFDINSTLGINLQCSRDLSTFETCQN